MDIRKKLEDKFLFFDGAMGTMLQRAGLELGQLTEIYNITHKEIILDIHRQYIEAGADIITTNTFGANSFKLSETQYSVQEVIENGVKLAKSVAGDKLVALDIGPTAKQMEPSGSLSFNEAYEVFKEQIIVGTSAGADLIIIETFYDLQEAKAAILAAKENCDLPIIATMTYQDDGRTLTGIDPITMVNVLEGLQVDGLGINCSLGPAQMQPVVDKILQHATVPVIVQSNAGLPRKEDNNFVYDITPKEFSKEMKKMAEKGVTIFGGCCGTIPEYIRLIKESLKDEKSN